MNNQSTPFSFILSASSVALTAALALASSAQPAQAQAQTGGDRIPVTLSDPARPASVKVSLINGGITVKAHDGKEVIVEARSRNHDRDRDDNVDSIKLLIDPDAEDVIGADLCFSSSFLLFLFLFTSGSSR